MTRRPVQRRTLLSAAVTVLGAGLIVTGTTHLHHPPPRRLAVAFGALPTAPDTARARASSATTAVRPAATPRAAPGVDGAAVPLRVRIARLHIDAPVLPVQAVGGAILVPAAPTTLGWWTGGAAPGAPVGATVIVGHVDSATRGLGALFHLDQVKAGDTVTVIVTGGREQNYRIVALRSIRKSRGLTNHELGVGLSPRLTLITCGGPFDKHTESYEDNIVAVALPASENG